MFQKTHGSTLTLEPRRRKLNVSFVVSVPAITGAKCEAGTHLNVRERAPVGRRVRHKPKRTLGLTVTVTRAIDARHHTLPFWAVVKLLCSALSAKHNQE